MKRLSILFAIAWVVVVTGCADPLEQRNTEEVGAQLQRGVTGQGTLGPIDRDENDQAGEHAVPQTHP